MAKVLLGVTGSVAATRMPALYQELKRAGHDVKVVATRAALYFFDPVALDPGRTERNKDIVVLDDDEWPGLDAGRHYRREEPVLHIELRRWADILLIAPLDANTLAKLANGLADNCLTCVYRAWDPLRPVILAPAMNTLMWQHLLTRRHLRQLAADAEVPAAPAELDAEDVVGWINEHGTRLYLVPPVSKRLACGDVGVGAMAALEEIAAAVARMSS